MSQLFEFRIFPQDGKPDRTEFHEARSEAGAKARAGRLAVANDCPVDVARFGLGGNADWNDRYLTTAAPEPYNASGYRFERLVS